MTLQAITSCVFLINQCLPHNVLFVKWYRPVSGVTRQFSMAVGLHQTEILHAMNVQLEWFYSNLNDHIFSHLQLNLNFSCLHVRIYLDDLLSLQKVYIILSLYKSTFKLSVFLSWCLHNQYLVHINSLNFHLALCIFTCMYSVAW